MKPGLNLTHSVGFELEGLHAVKTPLARTRQDFCGIPDLHSTKSETGIRQHNATHVISIRQTNQKRQCINETSRIMQIH
jgi:hypothetical protein